LTRAGEATPRWGNAISGNKPALIPAIRRVFAKFLRIPSSENSLMKFDMLGMAGSNPVI
jgi:hypothetical protein